MTNYIVSTFLSHALAAGGTTVPTFQDPIMKSYNLIDTTAATPGYSLTMEVGCADNYLNPKGLREVHMKLVLETENTPDDRQFYFGVLFNSETV